MLFCNCWYVAYNQVQIQLQTPQEYRIRFVSSSMSLMEDCAHSRLPNVLLTKELSHSLVLWVPTHNARNQWKRVSPQIHVLKYGSRYVTQHSSPRDVVQTKSAVRQLEVAAILYPFYIVMEFEVGHRVTAFLLKGRHLSSLWNPPDISQTHLKDNGCFPLATLCTPDEQLSSAKSLWKMLRESALQTMQSKLERLFSGLEQGSINHGPKTKTSPLSVFYGLQAKNGHYIFLLGSFNLIDIHTKIYVHSKG